MRVLVTGVSGFLGTAVAVELADRSATVVGVSRSAPLLPPGRGVRYAPVDLCAPGPVLASVAEPAPDTLVHLATAFTTETRSEVAAARDAAMWATLAGALAGVRRVVIASTELGHYGRRSLSAYQQGYVAAKEQLELAALAFHQETGVPVAIHRFPHLAGATELARDRRRARLVAKLLRSAAGAEPAPVEIYVPAATRMRFLHVREAAAVLADRAATARGFTVAECGPEAVTVDFAELVEVVERVVGTPPDIRWKHGAPTGPATLDEARAEVLVGMFRDTYARSGLDEDPTPVPAGAA
jgi:nucleoside-diphosphate-sugar epimerase